MKRRMAILEFRFWISDLMSSVFSVPLCETIRENDRSEVIGANRYWGSDVSITNTPVLGQQYSYEYDPIGNRISGGRASSQAVYDSNELNQYVSRTVPSTASVIGSALANVDVYVNGESVERQGNYWHSVVTVNNVPSPVYAEIEILGVLEPVNQNAPPEYSIATNHLFFAQSPELFEYDLDGNLTKDGRFNYTWNGENRLICVETRDDLPVEVPRFRTEHIYDHFGRRIRKEIFDSNNSKLKTISFLYDKWNLIAETAVDYASQTTNHCYYTWGTDLSGSLQGAGGVGGLLAVICNDETYSPTYDANGNISEYIASDGTIAAHYEYDAFGNTVVEYSPLLKGGGGNTAGGLPFSFRFSTKYWDAENELYYYGYRYLKPKFTRWLNRDPIKERGGLDLYGFVENNPINKFDYLGLWKDHRAQTRDMFNSLDFSVNEECKKKILDRLIKANKGQDNPLNKWSPVWSYWTAPLWDNPRHFNRDGKQTPTQGLDEYKKYVKEEMKIINRLMELDAEKTKWKDCKNGLDALGRLLHTWQDFFAHAYHPVHGWDAWENGGGGTPSEPGALYPSSYPGEHPTVSEPLDPNSEEYKKRYEASEEYTKKMMEEHINNWLKNCQKCCEK